MTEAGIGTRGVRWRVGGKLSAPAGDPHLTEILELLGVEGAGWGRIVGGELDHAAGYTRVAHPESGHTVPLFRVLHLEAHRDRSGPETPPAASQGV